MAGDRVARRMMFNEAAVGRVVCHSHLAPVLEVQLRRQPSYLVLPRIEGVTLSVLAREGQCCSRRALRVVRQVAEALAALHDRQWRHGDVKPDNILVSPGGHATLIDLSMAAPASDPLNGAGGTPPYAAPESSSGWLSAAGDIYSLGVALCELLGDGGPLRPPREPLTPPALDWLRSAPPGVKPLLRRMLAVCPDDRPSAAEVVDELTPLEVAALAAAVQQR